MISILCNKIDKEQKQTQPFNLVHKDRIEQNKANTVCQQKKNTNGEKKAKTLFMIA